jgi:protein transport protein SEC24
MSIDDRTFNMFAVQTMHVGASLAYLYPRLVPLLESSTPAAAEDSPLMLPSPVRCTVDKLRDDGVYCLDNGIHMFLWIGLSVSPEWIHGVFNTNSAAQIDIDRTKLLELDNARSQEVCFFVFVFHFGLLLNNLMIVFVWGFQVRCVINQLRSTRQRHMRLTLVRPRDKLEFVFRKFLVEDKHGDASSSYVDFLCHLHKEIRNLLN